MPAPKGKETAVPSIVTPGPQDIAAAIKPGQKPGQVLFNRPEIPTLFVSRMTHAKMSDGHAMLGFYCPTLVGEFEQVRVVITDTHAKRIIDLLCKQTGHYPTPEKDSGKK